MEHPLVEIARIDEKIGTICRDCKALDYLPNANLDEVLAQRRIYHSQLTQMIKATWKDPETRVHQVEETCVKSYDFSKPF